MAQLCQNTNTIKKAALGFFALVGIIAIGCLIGMGIVDHVTQAQQAVKLSLKCHQQSQRQQPPQHLPRRHHTR